MSEDAGLARVGILVGRMVGAGEDEAEVDARRARRVDIVGETNKDERVQTRG